MKVVIEIPNKYVRMAACELSSRSDDASYEEAVEKSASKVIDEGIALDLSASGEDLTELYLSLSAIAIGQMCAALEKAERGW